MSHGDRRDRRHRRDRDRDRYSPQRGQQQSRDTRYSPYNRGGGGGGGRDRGYQSYRDRGGYGGYRGRGGHRGFRGRGRGRGGRRGGRGMMQKYRYVGIINTRLVENVQSVYEFMDDAKRNYNTIENEKWTKNAPRPKNLQLTYKHHIKDIVTNSLRIDEKTIICSQYLFSVSNAEEKEELKENDRLKFDIYKKSRRGLTSIRVHFYDNLHIFSYNTSPAKELKNIQASINGKTYNITLSLQSSSTCNIDHDSKDQKSFGQYFQMVKKEYREMGLNVINRERFYSAGWNKIFRTDDIYYNLKEKRSITFAEQEGNMKYPNVSYLKGYKSTIHYAVNQQILIKTSINQKCITADSVYDFIKSYGRTATKQFVTGKTGITNYGESSIKNKNMRDSTFKIADLSTSMNLDSTFKKNDKDVTFRHYYTKDKGLKLHHENEKAMLVVHRYKWGTKKQEIEDTIHFPPQFVHILLTNNELKEETKSDRRRKSHPSVNEVIMGGIEQNKKLNNISRSISKLFETVTNQPVTVTGYKLNPPEIIYTGSRGELRVNSTEFTGRDWSQVNDLIYYHGDRGNKKWVIYYDKNDDRNNAENVRTLYDTFCDKRRFKKLPLAQPKVEAIDYNDLVGLRDRVRNNGCSVSLFIISNDRDMKGSKQKIDISKWVLFEDQPDAALTVNIKKSKRKLSYKGQYRKFDIQFILDANTRNNHAAFSTFETLFLKSDLGLYRLNPRLPSKKFDSKHLWIFGIEIARKKTINVVNITCNRAPFEGTLKFMSNYTYFIPKYLNVIPKYLMQQFMREIFDDSFVEVLKNKEKLPSNLIFLRCNAADSSFPVIMSKELAGIKKQLDVSMKYKSTEIEKITGHSTYNPGILFTIIQENVIDVFGVAQKDSHSGQSHIDMIRDAIIVNNGITSFQWLDCYMSYLCKQEVKYQRVMRWITLNDEYNSNDNLSNKPNKFLSKESELLSDYYQIIYSQFYMYAQGIPFAKTPKLPAPLVASKHMAQWRYEIITKDILNIRSMSIDVHNVKSKLLTIDTDVNINTNTNTND
eukprot:415259_1